jgi:hypothetical protein
LIVEISQAAVSTICEFQTRLDALKKQGKKSALVRIEREGAGRFVALGSQ